jgi:hypothetical protein
MVEPYRIRMGLHGGCGEKIKTRSIAGVDLDFFFHRAAARAETADIKITTSSSSVGEAPGF